jgi:hypothetical protein
MHNFKLLQFPSLGDLCWSGGAHEDQACTALRSNDRRVSLIAVAFMSRDAPPCRLKVSRWIAGGELMRGNIQPVTTSGPWICTLLVVA